jgi:hypothetical protein
MKQKQKNITKNNRQQEEVLLDKHHGVPSTAV